MADCSTGLPLLPSKYVALCLCKLCKYLLPPFEVMIQHGHRACQQYWLRVPILRTSHVRTSPSFRLLPTLLFFPSIHQFILQATKQLEAGTYLLYLLGAVVCALCVCTINCTYRFLNASQIQRRFLNHINLTIPRLPCSLLQNYSEPNSGNLHHNLLRARAHKFE